MAKIIVEIPDRLVDDFMGHMSDGGGEYGFMESFYEEGKFVNFDYKDGGIQITIRDEETGEVLER